MKYLTVVFFVLFNSTMANAAWRVVAPEQLREKTFAVSNWSYATEIRENPEALKAVIGVGCETDGHQWVYIRLSRHIENFNVKGRSAAVTGQLSWQRDTSYSAPFNYYPSQRVLFLQAGVSDAISLMKGSNSLALEVNWNDTQKNTFLFELSGSKTAIDAALSRCANSET